MSLVRIQNRGKNLIIESDLFQIAATLKPNNNINLGQRLRTITNNEYYVETAVLSQKKNFIPVKPNTIYTFTCQREIISDDGNSIYETILQINLNSKVLVEYNTVVDLTNRLRVLTFTTTPNTYYIAIRLNRYNTPHVAIVDYWNFQLEEGDTITTYEPARQDYLEFDGELFGYNGVYDELHDDGTLIKRWNRESITITAGSGTVSKTGTGTCILINETDGLPYEGTVSGTSISTSAPDGTYTVIYQLATPEIIDLNYDGELILYPGENNLILPDFAVASISGARKYLEG